MRIPRRCRNQIRRAVAIQYVGTTTPLTNAATWDSSVNPPLGNATTPRPILTETADRVTGTVFADQAGTLFIEQSSDGTNWDVSTSYAITASDGNGFSEEVVAPYARIRYVNGATPQTVFRLHARLSSAGVKP